MNCPYSSTSTMCMSKSYGFNLGQILNDKRKKEGNGDFHFIVNGKKIPAHKAVLRVASPYFETMFKSQFKESHSDTMDFSHMFDTVDSLESIISFMYVRTITICEETIENLLNAGCLFQIDSLCKMCTQYLFYNLGLQNALRVWALAELYGIKELTELCEFLVKHRFHDYFVKSDYVLELPKDFLSHVIEKGALDNLKCSQKVEFLLRWMNFEKSARESDLIHLLEKHSEQLEVTLPTNIDSASAISYLENISDHPIVKDKSQSKKGSLTSFKSSLLKQKSLRSMDSCKTVVCMVKKHWGQFSISRAVVELHSYLPDRNTWHYVGSLSLQGNDFTNIEAFRGFTKIFAVFETCDKKVCLWNMETGNYRLVPGPEIRKENDIKPQGKPLFFCFDNRVFFLDTYVSYKLTKPHAKNHGRKRKKSAPKQEDMHTVIRTLHILEENDNWSHCYTVKTYVKTSDSFFLEHHYETFITKNEVFLVASAFPHNTVGMSYFDVGKNQLYAYVIKRQRNIYTMKELPDIPSNFAWSPVFKIGQTLDGQLVISMKPRHKDCGITQFILGKNRDTWTEETSKAALVNSPAPDTVEEILRPAKTEYSTDVPTINQAFYAVDFPGPFVSRLWCHEKQETGSKNTGAKWKMLPGPPVTNVYSVTEIFTPTTLVAKFSQGVDYDEKYLTSTAGPFKKSDDYNIIIPSGVYTNQGEERNASAKDWYYYTNRYDKIEHHDDPFQGIHRKGSSIGNTEDESYSSDFDQYSSSGMGFGYSDDDNDDDDEDDDMFF